MVISARAVPEIVAKTAVKLKTQFSRWVDRIAEQQMRKARFEMQMYGGTYKHSSKNDDDLPVVR